MGGGERRLAMDVDEALLEIPHPLQEADTISPATHELLFKNFEDFSMFAFEFHGGNRGALIDALGPQVLKVWLNRDRKAAHMESGLDHETTIHATQEPTPQN